MKQIPLDEIVTDVGTRPLYCGKTLAAWVAGEVVIHRTRRVA